MELFKKGLDENSEMEFNSSRFIAAVGIDVLDSVEFRDVFDDGDNSFEVISFNKVNDFLAEEFSESGVAFFSELGIFLEVFSHLDGEEVDQMLGSCILDWHLYDLFSVVYEIGDSVNN